ncbi:sigma-E processing peptidase SpoIIGA [Caloranaerobacter azorensis]|uniref:Sporulation sigma-E factor-processing peptidase n=3 Tax=Caloranaerobacter azorensis TaxID=116090 RepID=A0A1M5U1N0_9FIRM|nr:sigma-E processing peptidase SpoIIGA [Caloranaerobacter azorensis]KGG80576.1 sporulation sigma-E factor-processing peptidase SpoIIGA [Caloranaerobacter azorensis H53214]QIB26684.1 sigma-E processing peptidase SpoIIGA [Caloranaerobacter azorensis]SHH56932.1 stage II sporulation protein GA (sporulation sigma-E factor processing peptidase) [Caloranaerobacter azorensis DSM 13643]
MYIYAEYLILENFIINFIILYVTKRFTRTETTRLRLILAALIGAIYTLVIFYPKLSFMVNFTMKITISILIIIVAFNPITLKKFIKLIATFYIVSFVFAGSALALFYLIDVDSYISNGIFYIKDFPIKILIFAIITSWILIKYTLSYIQGRISRDKILVPISILLRNKEAHVVALVDTGNSLKDPLTDVPVIIVQFSAIKDILPEKTKKFFEMYNVKDLQFILPFLQELGQDLKIRIIPFKTIGKENGVLFGFKPDKVIIKDQDRAITDIIVGICNDKLSNDNKYEALLHPELLN